jgi:hypothetical protein
VDTCNDVRGGQERAESWVSEESAELKMRGDQNPTPIYFPKKGRDWGGITKCRGLGGGEQKDVELAKSGKIR